MINIILLDNIDSFTYNLVDQLRDNKCKVLIYNNKIPIATILNLLKTIKNPILMLSPGPGYPSSAGCMMQLIHILKGKIPIIGICLGYQAIIESYGGHISESKEIFHGRTSLIYHDTLAMFHKIPNPLLVGRYHSLISSYIPDTLTINAYYNKHTIMAVRNDSHRICGFQFHPESILTTYGTQLINQTIAWTIQ